MSESIIREYAKSTGVSEAGEAELVAALEQFQDDTKFKVQVYGQDRTSLTAAPRQLLDLHEIELFNFKNTDKRRIEIKPGTTMICGPNDSGKSSWLQGLRFAVQGVEAIGSITADRLIKDGQKMMQVEAAFTGLKIVRGANMRQITRGERAGQLELNHELVVEAEGSKDSTPKKAQALIDTYLGLDAGFLLQSCFISQGEITAILDQQPAKRREMIYKLMGLDRCDESATRIRKWVDGLAQQVVGASNAAATLLAQREAALAKRNQIPATQLRQKLELLEASGDPGAAARARRNELNAQIGGLVQLEEKHGQQATQKARLTEKLNELRADPVLALAFDDLTQKVAQAQHNYNAAREGRNRLAIHVQEIIAKGQALKTLPATCETCALIGKQCDLGPTVKEAKRQELLAAHKEKSAALTAAQAQEHDCNQELERLMIMDQENQKSRSRRQNVVEQTKLVEEALAGIPADALDAHAKVQRDLMLARAELADLDKAPAAEDQRPALRRQIAEADALDAELKQIDAKRKAAGEAPTLGGPNALAKAFAKDGIPLYLARRHVGRINEIAAELAAGDKFVYRFNDELEVEVQSGKSTIHPRLASGSARQRGAVVLVAALGRYMQELLNVQVPVFWLDEIPFQDDANTEAIVHMVKSLTKWYPKVVFAASQWDRFSGEFDFEIALGPDKVASDLDEVRQRLEALEPSEPGQLLKLDERSPMVKTLAAAHDANTAKDEAPKGNPTSPARVDALINPPTPEPVLEQAALDEDLPF